MQTLPGSPLLPAPPPAVTPGPLPASGSLSYSPPPPHYFLCFCYYFCYSYSSSSSSLSLPAIPAPDSPPTSPAPPSKVLQDGEVSNISGSGPITRRLSYGHCCQVQEPSTPDLTQPSYTYSCPPSPLLHPPPPTLAVWRWSFLPSALFVPPFLPSLPSSSSPSDDKPAINL